MPRWIGIDFGTKRIGLAVGDTDERIISPLEQLQVDKMSLNQVAKYIKTLAKNYGAVGAVVGWPINVNGSRGEQSQLALRFAADLAERTGLDVRLWDERLTSFDADSRLRGQYTQGKRKQRQDSIAAMAILEDFFASDGPSNAQRPEELTK